MSETTFDFIERQLFQRVEQKKLVKRSFKEKRNDYTTYIDHLHLKEQDLIEKTKNNYKKFLEDIRPYVLAEFQVDIVDVLNDLNTKVKLIVLPREHGKSTLGCEEFLCWYGLYHPFHYAMIFSETAGQAHKRGKQIRDVIKTTPELQSLKQLTKESWGTESFMFRNGFFVEMFGAGAGVSGSKYLDRRPDVIILDDVVPATTGKITDENISNWFKETVANLGGPDTIFIIIGTPYRNKDLISELRAEKNIMQLYYEALLGKDIEAMYNKIPPKVLWPAHWPLKRLINQFEKKLLGNRLIFARQYLCRVVTEGSKLYPNRIVNPCKDPTLSFQLTRREAPFKYAATVMGVDIASSDEVGADYFVCEVYGITHKGKFHLLWMERHKGLPPDHQRALVWSLQDRFELDLTVIEDNSYQRVFAMDIEKGNVFPVHRHTTHKGNKNDELLGLPKVKTHLTNRRIVYPEFPCNYRQSIFEDDKDDRGDPITHVYFDESDSGAALVSDNLFVLYDEMEGWQWDGNQAKWISVNKHDDTVLCQWFTCLAGEKYGNYTFSYSGSSPPPLESAEEREQKILESFGKIEGEEDDEDELDEDLAPKSLSEEELQKIKEEEENRKKSLFDVYLGES